MARDPSIVPPPITRTEPATVEFTLTVKELTAELADGTTYDFWTFDGTVPGPLLRVMEGDTVKLTLVNPPENKIGHDIDLHAVNGPGGGAAVTKVNPGESKTFSFKALNAGLFIYHCAFSPPMHHIAQGMYGAILVEPRGGLPKVDREFYVVQGEWYTSGSRAVSRGQRRRRRADGRRPARREHLLAARAGRQPLGDIRMTARSMERAVLFPISASGPAQGGSGVPRRMGSPAPNGDGHVCVLSKRSHQNFKSDKETRKWLV